MDHRHLAVRMEQGLAVDHRGDAEIGARAARALERPVAVARLAVDDDDRAAAGVGHVEEARVALSRTKTANWTKTWQRRLLYGVLAPLTRGRIDLLPVPAIL